MTLARIAALCRGQVEWPTLALLAATYGGFGLLTWFYEALPWWLLAAAGGYLVCLHGSLQHEAVHGHPTRLAWLNEALVSPSLQLWLPFGLYRETHLAHHGTETITDPLSDPESYYVAQATWQRLGPLARGFLWVRNTLAGRLLLGPLESVARTWSDAARRLARGERAQLGHWGRHLPAVAPVLLWVVVVCGMPLEVYLLLFAYPGLSLTLLRSYLEHQAHEAPERRTVLIETGPLFALMFLNNNLHALHHAEPWHAWYRLPARYRALRARLLADNGGYLYPGYLAIALRHLLWPKEPPVHPVAAARG